MITEPLMTSNADDWITPPWLIKRARACLGSIDLDPASSERANMIVCASKYLTREMDALKRPWYGRVWLNPPYGRAVRPFVEKLVAEFISCNVSSALCLVAARTDTAWFRLLGDYPKCFLWGRIRFLDGKTGKEAGVATFPSCVVGLGINSMKLATHFGDVGDVYERIK